MTEVTRLQAPGLQAPEMSTAGQQADAAAAASGVAVRELLEVDDLQRVCDLIDEIWHPQPANLPVSAEFLRALAHAGNYVTGAFTGEVEGGGAGGRMVGCCVGFFGSPETRVLHSHVAGVSPRLIGKHVGFALKLHQRAWALARGITTITWTFDPLVCRNAYFNIAKLAASPAEYLPDFYGVMDDVINAGDDSDRLLVHWRLAADSVVRACAGAGSGADAAALRAAGAAVALDIDAGGRPAVGEPGPGAATVLVRVPRDIETLRRHDEAAARRWRRAVRHVLGGLMAEGGRVTGFDRAGFYVVERGDEAGHVPPERKAST
jgi:predicted GNAT superfamily acetyltransferase